MKSFKTYPYFILILTMAFSACEKEITVDLKDATPKYVVEAFVTDSANFNMVKISKSVGFYDDNNFEKISGASVSVSDNLGNLYTFTEVEQGLYKSDSMLAQVGRMYQLSVSTNNFKTVASSTVPSKVTIDSLSFEERTDFGGDKSYRLRVHFSDPGNETNYYRFLVFFNNSDTYKTYVTSDLYFNGKQTSYPLFNSNLNINDTVTVIMENIDKTNYIYFNTLDEISQSSFSGTIPGNPENNFDNSDVLGYFGAYSVSTKSIIFKLP